MSLQVTTTNGSISDVKMNSEKVEGLCYPLLFSHEEPGFTYEMKEHIPPADYVIAMLKYMTSPARYYSET
jgi:hypothetical protein